MNLRKFQIFVILIIKILTNLGFSLWLRRRIEQRTSKAVRFDRVMMNELDKGGKAGFFGHVEQALLVFVDTIVIDTSLASQRDGQLTGQSLGLAHQEAAIDAAREEVLGGDALDFAVVPRVLVERVHRLDVGGGHPADEARVRVLHLAPLARLVEREYVHLVALVHVQVFVDVGHVVVQRHVEIRVAVAVQRRRVRRIFQLVLRLPFLAQYRRR